MTRRHLVTLCITIVLIMAGYGIFIPIITHAVQVQQTNISNASLILSFFALGQFISSPLMGNYADHHGCKRTLLIGMIGYFSSLAVTLVNTNLWVILPLRLVSGIFAGAGVSSVENYISKIGKEKDKSMYYTFTSISIGAGMIIGPALGFAYIFFPMLVSLCLCLTGLAMVIIVGISVPRDEVLAVEEQGPFLKSFLKEFKSATTNSQNRFILSSVFLFGLITSGIETVGLLYVTSYFWMSPLRIIEIIALIVTLTLYVLIVSPKVINQPDKHKLNSQLVLVISCGLLLLTATFWQSLMMFGIFLVVAGMSSLIAGLTLFVTEVNENSGTMLGTRNSVLSIGSILGPILVSSAYGIHPQYSLYVLIGACMIIWTYGQTICKKETDANT